MTNATAIAQGPLPASEAISGRSRNAGRSDGGEAEGGGFPSLLERLRGGSRDRNGGGAADTSEPPPANCDCRRMPGWLTANARALADEASAEAVEDAAPDLAATMDGAMNGGSTLVPNPAELSALPVPSVPGDAAALAAQSAGAGARDAVAVQQPGEAEDGTERLSQALAQLTEPPSGNSHSPASAGRGDDIRLTVAEVAVLRRETHLAPARAAVMAEAATGLNRNRRDPQAAHARLDADVGDAAALLSGGTAERSAAAQPLAPHLAVNAAHATDRGALLRSSVTSQDTPAGIETALQAADAPLSEQASPTVRVDALLNTGPASGAVQQLAQRIAGEAGTASAAPQGANAPALVQHSPYVPATKVLHIQLQPADLGIVTVRMSLRDQALQLDLEVGRGETAHLIQREQETLSSLLRSAGYLIDGLDVRLADQSNLGASAGGSQPNAQLSGGSQPGSSGGDARSQGARPQDERRDSTFGNERNRSNEQTGHAPRRGGIYV